MNIETKEIKGCQISISAEIPWEEADMKITEIAKKIQKKVVLDGFRPGKVPINYLKKVFARDLQDEFLRDLVPKIISSYLEKEDLKIASQPYIEKFVFVEKCPVTIVISLEILPKITLKQYKGIEIKEDKIIVEEKEIEERILDLRRKEAHLIPVESREAKENDYIIANITMTKETNRKEEISFDVNFILGAPEIISELNNTVLGMKINERRSFELPLAYPESAQQPKSATISVLLKEIKEVSLPSIEEIMKSYSECETIEDLKKYIHEELLLMKEAQKENLIKEKILNKLIEDYDFEIPSTMYYRQLNFLYKKEANKLKRRWIDVPLFLIDTPLLKDKLSKQAINIIKETLILEEIAKEENISLSEEEEKKSLEDLAKEIGLNPLALKAKLEKEGEYDNFLVNWLNDKVVDFLYQYAIINE